MKKTMLSTIITAVISLLCLEVYAQRDTLGNDYEVVDHNQVKTLFGNKDHSYGGYFSFDMDMGQLKGEETIELGGRLGCIIDHKFTIGFQGMGIANDLTIQEKVLEQDVDILLVGGYGGMFLEPIIFPLQPIHVSFPLFFGVGGAGFISNTADDELYYTYHEDADAFLVLRPGVEVELNLLKYFRIGIGARYRYLYDLNLRYEESYLNNSILNGFSGGISFKFGKF